MLYVLYRNSGVYSGRALRKALQDTTGKLVRGGFPKHHNKAAKKTTPTLIINLGTTEDLSDSIPVLNPREMVRAAANKKAARRVFAAQNIPAPAFFENFQQIPADAFPVIARTSFHSKGKGFWFCPTPAHAQKAAAAGATHFLQFVPDTREYRVHTFIKSKALQKEREDRTPDDYLSIKISEKVWVGHGTPPKNVYQKNHEFGWTFLGQQNRREEELDVVRLTAKRAAAALGMDFGAVDVMYSVLHKQPYVLEVNSTPSLADENADTCERYAKRISRIAEKLLSPKE